MKIKLTKKRQLILDTLKCHQGTLSAKDIHAHHPEIDLATIYRNLELFVDEKLITRVHLGTDEAQYEFQREHHHHGVCTDCHKIIHFKAPDDKIKKLLGIEDFDIEELEVTVRGVCRNKK